MPVLHPAVSLMLPSLNSESLNRLRKVTLGTAFPPSLKRPLIFVSQSCCCDPLCKFRARASVHAALRPLFVVPHSFSPRSPPAELSDRWVPGVGFSCISCRQPVDASYQETRSSRQPNPILPRRQPSQIRTAMWGCCPVDMALARGGPRATAVSYQEEPPGGLRSRVFMPAVLLRVLGQRFPRGGQRPLCGSVILKACHA